MGTGSASVLYGPLVKAPSTKHLFKHLRLHSVPYVSTTPNLRHQASGGGTVTITSSVAIVNDTTWSTIVGTWRPGRLELYVDGWSRASGTATTTNTSALFGIYRWGWGFSTSQDFKRRHRAHRVFRIILDPRDGAALARRSVRLPAPMERGAGAHGECATRHATLDQHRRSHFPDGAASWTARVSSYSRPAAMIDWIKTAQGRWDRGRGFRDRGHPVEPRPAAPGFLARGAESRPDRGALEQSNRDNPSPGARPAPGGAPIRSACSGRKCMRLRVRMTVAADR
jgi:Concanavalin A-like lectin/glucanases superfamily